MTTTVTLDQATWDAEMERIHAHYQAIHHNSLQEAKLQFMDAYDAAVSQVVMIGLGLLILMMLGMCYVIAQHTASCALPV